VAVAENPQGVSRRVVSRGKNEGRTTMTNLEIREEILDILADIAPDEDLSELDDSASFRDQMELDSMDFLDIVMELRKRHRVQIPEEDYEHLASLASTVAYLEPRMKDIQKV
jgi:acyl carrier protein